MTKRWTLIALATFVLTISSAMVAQAQTGNRLYLASTGNDANNALTPPCPQATPCKSAGGAIGHVNAGGTIVVLDSEGIGGVTITQAVTIVAVPGAEAHIVVVSGASGIVVNGGANDVIVLRNLNVNGLGAANTTGLQHNSGKLKVQHCLFENLTTGVSVVNARADLIDCNLFGNGTAVISNGSGANNPGNPATTSVALVRINGGNITDNGTGLSQVNPGTFGGQNLFNIVVFSAAANQSASLNMIGNTTNNACSGTPMCGPFPLIYQLNNNIQ